MEVQAQTKSSKPAEKGVVTNVSAKSRRARDMFQVVVRVAPHTVNEHAVLRNDGDGRITVLNPSWIRYKNGSINPCTLSPMTEKLYGPETTFELGTVIWPDGDIGETVGTKAAEDALNGFNVSIFAYGETGSGKTSSLFGKQNTPSAAEAAGGELGLSNKICNGLLHRRDSVVSSIGVSFIEIHKGRVRSLLKGGACGLRARRDRDLDSLDTVKVESLDHFQELVVDGLLERQESLKGHALLSLKVEAVGGRITRVNMVDLAGSECGCIDLQVRKDLLNLRAVLRGVSSKKTAAIPFRESTLTSLLKDSLSVRARTTVLGTVNPSPSSFGENVKTLKFAQLLHVNAMDRTSAKVSTHHREAFVKAMKALGEKMDSLPEELQDDVVTEGKGRTLTAEEVAMWLAGEDREDFEVDAMAFVRRTTRSVKQTTLGQKVRKGRGEGKANAAGREENAEDGRDDLSSFMGGEEEKKVQRRTRNGRYGGGTSLEARVAALELKIAEQSVAFDKLFAEERQQRQKDWEEDQARVRAMEARLLERIQHLERLLANRGQHRVHARLDPRVEQRHEVVEEPGSAHGPHYTRILLGCGVALGAFGLLGVVLMLYLKVTYGPLVI